MSRPLRIEIEDGIYHVTCRGLERRRLLTDDRDRQKWTEMLAAVCERRSWRIFAWALMENHFHIFLRTPHADISDGMHDLNSGYASWFNLRHRRAGPLFQGRFKAILIEREYHYWELSRYVHLNPVRAGLADKPEAYRWSSCRFYFKESGAPNWLAWEEILREHGRSLKEARTAYRAYLSEGLASPPPSPLKEIVASTLLGTSGFLAKMRDRLLSRRPDRDVPAARQLIARVPMEAIERFVRKVYKVSPNILRSRGRRNNEARAVAIYLCRGLTTLKGSDIGSHFGGVREQSVSNVVAQIRQKRKQDQRFSATLAAMESSIRVKCRM